jgi:hypothetical protein
MDEDGFVRQRRNLIAISLLLAFTQGTGLTLTELNILGNKAILERQLAVEPIFWIAWGYLFLRYWQAFVEYGGPRFFNKYREKLQTSIHLYVADRLSPLRLPSNVMPSLGKSATSVTATINSMEVPRTLFATVELRFQYLDIVPAGQGDIMTTAKTLNLKWTLGPSVVVPLRARNLIDSAINTSIVTELYLPFLIGLCPLLLAALQQ